MPGSDRLTQLTGGSNGLPQARAERVSRLLLLISRWLEATVQSSVLLDYLEALATEER
jgi:hypothetical protein